MATEIRLASRPNGMPTLDNFATVEVDTPTAGSGQVLVRNVLLSVDPYMRGRMSTAKSYVAPYEVNEVMDGGAIGEVIESRVDSVTVGDYVLHDKGWRSHAVLAGEQVSKVDPAAAPLSAYLGVLGMTGLTAYAGLMRVAEFQPGDTVFVSAAAGAVGSVVGQLAKFKGARRVVGSAGSAEKVEWLKSGLGFDAAFNYKDAPVIEQLGQAAPDGVDIYFDNVGGDHLEAAIDSLNVHGRIAVCGMISQYNATAPQAAPRNLSQIIAKRFSMRGMLVADHTDLRGRFVEEVAPRVQSGELEYSETFEDGLANMPQAFLDVLGGTNTGKMLVRA